MNLFDRNQKQREFFNEKIDTYDKTHEIYMETKESIAKKLDKSTKKILDLGAGTGLELISIFEYFPDAEITVIDISENMLKKLKERKLSSNINIICGDFFDIDFGNEYDAVVSTSALHHFKQSEKLVLYKKIYECLNNNGQFINCDKIALTKEIEEKQLFDLENNFDKYKHIDIPMTCLNEKFVLEKTGFKNIEILEVDKEDYRLMISRKL